MENTLAKNEINVTELVGSIPEEQKALLFSLLAQGQSLENKVKYAKPLDMSQIEITIQSNGKKRTVSTRCLIAQFIDENTDRLHNESRVTYIHALNWLFDYLEERHISKPEELTLKQWVEYTENSKPITTPSGRNKGYGLGSTTTHLYLIACKRFFKWTEKKCIYPDIAFDVTAQPIKTLYGKKEALNDEDFSQLLASIDTSTLTGLRNRLIVIFEACLGLRDVEISRMKDKDINFKKHFITIHGKGKGKEGKTRIVGLAPQVERELKAYRSKRSERKTITEEDFIFIGHGINNEGESLSAKSIGRIVKMIMEKSGLVGSRYTAHSLRHTFATDLFEADFDPKKIQLALGHSDLKTTLIYDETATHDFSCFYNIADRLLKERDNAETN